MRYPRPTTSIAALLLLAGLAAPALASRDVVVRSESKTFNVEDAHRLKVDVSVGEVHVQAGGDRIEVQLEVTCNASSTRCRERAQNLQLEPTRSGDDVSLKMRGYDRDGKRGINHPQVDLHLTIPAALAVVVDMGVGELEVAGIESDVTVDLGVGEARIDVPERAVKSVSLDVGVGEAHLSPRQEESHRSGFLFLGNEVDWREGTGRSRVAVDVGVGEAHVRLVP
ncbi:MAG TPA: hypothetical protein VGS57_11225 [Thermoanaerobaculia bacterium]|jgi:hypothetical protein|nr:hypothetical protein [Thermoanaerobaculia bacterium]